MKSDIVLVADIGASKVKVGCFQRASGNWSLERVDRYLTDELDGLVDALQRTLRSLETPVRLRAVSVGVAGPVLADTVSLTNLSWTLNRESIRRALGADSVLFVNDLEAHAHGVLALGAEGLMSLHDGHCTRVGNRALIAAGTGLGEGLLVRHGDRLLPQPSEGGHCEFGPRNADEVELVSFLLNRYEGHVSWERVVSGKFGFRNLFDFYHQTGRAKAPEDLLEAIGSQDEIGSELVQAALDGVPIAVQVLDHFMELYGAEAGNLVLKGLALEGIYIAGGIVRRTIPLIQRGSFLKGFFAKGRFESMMRQVPVWIVTDHECALHGLARVASLSLDGAN